MSDGEGECHRHGDLLKPSRDLLLPLAHPVSSRGSLIGLEQDQDSGALSACLSGPQTRRSQTGVLVVHTWSPNLPPSSTKGTSL